MDGLLCEVRKTFSYHFQVGLRSLFRVDKSARLMCARFSLQFPNPPMICKVLLQRSHPLR